MKRRASLICLFIAFFYLFIFSSVSGTLSSTARIGSTVRAARLRFWLLCFPFLLSSPTVQSVVYNLGISFFIFIEFMYLWNPNAKCAWLNIHTWFFSGSFRWNTSASPKGAFKTVDVRERARSSVVASWRRCCFRCHGGSHREGGQWSPVLRRKSSCLSRCVGMAGARVRMVFCRPVLCAVRGTRRSYSQVRLQQNCEKS